MRDRKIAADLANDAPLRLGQLEAGALEQSIRKLPRRRDGPCRVAPDFIPQLPQREVMGEQLLEGEPSLCGMPAFFEFVKLCVRWRAMQELKRFAQRGELQFVADFPGQPVRQLAVADRGERLRGEVAQPSLLDALGDRIDRREYALNCLRVGRIRVLVFGVDNFGPVLAAAHLAEAAKPRAAHELLLLRAAEMEEAQRQESRAVGEAHEQRAAPAEHDFRQLDRAFNRGARARPQRADRHDVSAILVSCRQPEEEVGDGLDAELRESLRERRPDALEPGDRASLDRHGTRMQSTSIAAPRGNAAAPMVTRAG